MPRDERRRQQALAKHAAKRKQKKQALARAAASQPRFSVTQAAGWPLHACLLPATWQEPGEIIQILVARQGPAGAIGAAMFLVDLGCLGVKNALARVFPSRFDYEDELRDLMASQQRMIDADLDLVAKIIREGIAYARSLGFNPHRDFAPAALLLAGADPDACPTPIPLGKDGKPFFVAGPYDNATRVMAQLTKAVGPGNFEYVVPIGAPPGLTAL